MAAAEEMDVVVPKKDPNVNLEETPGFISLINDVTDFGEGVKGSTNLFILKDGIIDVINDPEGNPFFKIFFLTIFRLMIFADQSHDFAENESGDDQRNNFFSFPQIKIKETRNLAVETREKMIFEYLKKSFYDDYVHFIIQVFNSQGSNSDDFMVRIPDDDDQTWTEKNFPEFDDIDKNTHKIKDVKVTLVTLGKFIDTIISHIISNKKNKYTLAIVLNEYYFGIVNFNPVKVYKGKMDDPTNVKWNCTDNTSALYYLMRIHSENARKLLNLETIAEKLHFYGPGKGEYELFDAHTDAIKSGERYSTEAQIACMTSGTLLRDGTKVPKFRNVKNPASEMDAASEPGIVKMVDTINEEMFEDVDVDSVFNYDYGYIHSNVSYGSLNIKEEHTPIKVKMNNIDVIGVAFVKKTKVLNLADLITIFGSRMKIQGNYYNIRDLSGIVSRFPKDIKFTKKTLNVFLKQIANKAKKDKKFKDDFLEKQAQVCGIKGKTKKLGNKGIKLLKKDGSIEDIFFSYRFLGPSGGAKSSIHIENDEWVLENKTVLYDFFLLSKIFQLIDPSLQILKNDFTESVTETETSLILSSFFNTRVVNNGVEYKKHENSVSSVTQYIIDNDYVPIDGNGQFDLNATNVQQLSGSAGLSAAPQPADLFIKFLDEMPYSGDVNLEKTIDRSNYNEIRLLNSSGPPQNPKRFQLFNIQLLSKTFGDLLQYMLVVIKQKDYFKMSDEHFKVDNYEESSKYNSVDVLLTFDRLAHQVGSLFFMGSIFEPVGATNKLFPLLVNNYTKIPEFDMTEIVKATRTLQSMPLDDKPANLPQEQFPKQFTEQFQQDFESQQPTQKRTKQESHDKDDDKTFHPPPPPPPQEDEEDIDIETAEAILKLQNKRNFEDIQVDSVREKVPKKSRQGESDHDDHEDFMDEDEEEPAIEGGGSSKKYIRKSVKKSIKKNKKYIRKSVKKSIKKNKKFIKKTVKNNKKNKKNIKKNKKSIKKNKKFIKKTVKNNKKNNKRKSNKKDKIKRKVKNTKKNNSKK